MTTLQDRIAAALRDHYHSGSATGALIVRRDHLAPLDSCAAAILAALGPDPAEETREAWRHQMARLVDNEQRRREAMDVIVRSRIPGLDMWLAELLTASAALAEVTP
jgi:hypothetical protein